MKFSKSLHKQIVETLPEWRDKFLSYKDLKKWLKLLGGAVAGERQSKRQRVGDGSPSAMTTEDAAFVALLEAELDKFNGFFLEKEEDYVIRQKELQDRVVRAAETGSAEELMWVRKEIVDLHGEMVLLENYSSLNYTGLVKILKKYDKRTGALIRLPFIQSVMQEPFFTTDLLNKLVKDCEAMLEQLVPRSQPSVPNEDGREDSEGDDNPANPSASLANGAGGEALELEDIEVMESMYMKSTVAALRALKENRSGSSTVSAFSLPPLHGGGAHEQRGTLSRKT
ncbi:hypothetical protein QOZ80_2AG0105430 [Eleusine coracana subsp. coracana]|nr:hypothetical protein QOZ80_2AG0105430 [Eleusine coracana subsp. coracana]